MRIYHDSHECLLLYRMTFFFPKHRHSTGTAQLQAQAQPNVLLVTTRNNATDLMDSNVQDLPAPYAGHLTFVAKLLIITNAVQFGMMTLGNQSAF